MVNYGNAKIYKMVNNVDGKIYIGSTCSPLSKRKGQHKANLKKFPEMKSYKHFNEVGWENVNIILIERIECKNKDELLKRERYWIDELSPELNKQLPKNPRLECQRSWRLKNKERISEHNKKNYKKKTYTYEEIEERRKLKEERALARKQRAKEKISCECGSKVTRSDKARHEKSLKHKKWLESK